MVGCTMSLRLGDHVQIRPGPDIDPHLWDHEGQVVGAPDDHHVLVELDTGEDCILLPDQLIVKPTMGDLTQSPFDVFPGPQRRR